jgi:molybdopterin molybdotransferase
MISVTEAKAIIKQAVNELPVIKLSLLNAFECVLAEDVYAVTDIPAFAQSSMDGYAIRYTDKSNPLQVFGEMAAGTAQPRSIQPNQAVRIFTGAPLPEGADAVVMQEKISLDNGTLLIHDDQLQQYSNVRNKGAEVAEGALAMPKGTLLTAAAIGFLAGIGFTEVSVYPSPSVAVILTGNELQTPGEPLGFGQVYESNSIMLTVALKKSGITNVRIFKAEDDLEALQVVLATALQECDVVLLTGGVSVGDYDFVVRAAQHCQVEQRFHKLKQKPGKPLFFGVKEQKLIYGLPGNPSSVLTCFYEYVVPALELIMHKTKSIIVKKAILTHDCSKIKGLTQFLKAKYADGKVSQLHAQDSFRLASFSQADCLIVLEEGVEYYQAGEEVEVHLLP